MEKMKWKGAAVPGLVLSLLLALSPTAYALDAEALIPVGSTVGIRMDAGGVIVSGLSEVMTPEGARSPAGDAGIAAGDVITSLAGRETADAGAFLTAIRTMDGAPVELTVLRDGKKLSFQISPAKNTEGKYQLGLWLRDGVSGIGTVTFYDPVSGIFGALGHGISDTESGELLPVEQGSICASSVVDVVPGCAGSPGELCGQFDETAPLGSVSKNTEEGIFGVAEFAESGTPLPVAGEDEVHLGPATILANVSGSAVEPYSVEISRVYRGGGDDRFLMLTVTDSALLERTGGIVQGMSGSPILQDGKLIGAVTHVLVNDPTRGYGISIQNMLNAA